MRPNQYKMSRSPHQRFEGHYIPEPNSGCWLWTGGINNNGYGRFSLRRNTGSAHRASWQLHKGLIPDGMHVLHKCDNRVCVNPDHLFLGTIQDNCADMVRKGRQSAARGSRKWSAKLTEEQVRVIRLSDKRAPDIAAEFGVSPVSVWAIRRGHQWKHVITEPAGSGKQTTEK